MSRVFITARNTRKEGEEEEEEEEKDGRKMVIALMNESRRERKGERGREGDWLSERRCT